MAIIDLGIYMRFDRENRSGCNFTPQSLFTVKSLINFQICCPHKIKFANTNIMKICNQIKVSVLNVNMGSDFSQDAR